MQPKLSQLVFLLILTALVDCKRSKGAVGLWSNKRRGSSGVQVRRTKAQPSEPKEPVMKSANVEVNKPLGSNVDSSDLNKKIRKAPKFKEKRSARAYPTNLGYSGISDRGYNSINTEGYPHLSEQGYEDNAYDGLRKSSGSSDKHVFRNILNGVFACHLVTGVVSRRYKIYNFYNQPKEERAEIILPANVLTTCNENATDICVPGTNAICTQDSKILCITAMTLTSPCQGNSEEKCVNSTIPCFGAKDPLCQNQTQADNTTVILTCFATMTLENGRSSLIPKNEDNQFCVTTMAVPDPNLSVEENKRIEDSDATDENTAWDFNNLGAVGYDRYIVINH